MKTEKLKNKKKYNPRKFNPSKGGHAPGHLREFFENILELLSEENKVELNTKIPDPEYGKDYTVGEILGLLWNCTDCLPSMVYDEVANHGECGGTYGAAARLIKNVLTEIPE